MTPRESLDVNSVGDRSAPREVSWTALSLAYSLHDLLTACHCVCVMMSASCYRYTGMLSTFFAANLCSV